jgi:uncharacterized damage-inducible protein DinB
LEISYKINAHPKEISVHLVKNIMDNLSFFKSCFSNEMAATVSLFASFPDGYESHRSHPVNRSVGEIMEHILCHLVDLDIILKESVCDEALVFDVVGPQVAAANLTKLWQAVEKTLEATTPEQWESESVALLLNGAPFVTLPRMQMMWFFFFDIIHHRGQLSTYVRPTGGKVPAIYGFSADTLAASAN